MNQLTRRVLFLLFFLSGFSSLAYQVIWTRMAFASFGIITPVLSVVLSVFMLGLAVGAWAGGRCIAPLVEKTGLSAIVFYAGAEFLIGLGAFAVPKLFAAGEHFLLAAGQTNSVGYLSLSALVLAFSILPWCLFMGTTFPLMMAYIRERDSKNTESFSFLYLANVLGAMSGTFLTAVVLVELLGFHHTLWVAAAGNFIITLIGGCLGWRQRGFVAVALTEAERSAGPGNLSSPGNARRRLIKWILFSTGFSAMAMEVVWTRAFTPVLKTQVYSFALVVFTYLGATFLGSWWYRHHLKKNSPWPTARLMSLLVVAGFLPILAGDPRFVKMDWEVAIDAISAIIVLAGLCPFCAILGYLTPSLIDEYATGDPAVAGRAYAVNVLGCILGPLFACYVLLPWISERTLCINPPQSAFFRVLPPPSPLAIPVATTGMGTGCRRCSGGITVPGQGFRDHAAAHPKKHGRPAGLRRHGHFLWRGARQTPSGQRHGHDDFDTDYQIHGASAAGFASGKTRIGTGCLFRHGHDLSFRFELGILTQRRWNWCQV